MTALDALPVWATAALLFVLLVLACEAGVRLNRGPDDSETHEEGYLVSAALGLLALLLGFTFSLALDRYEQRRELVVSEASAIGTAWLRADILPAEAAAALRVGLVDYAETRLAMARAGEDRAAVARLDTRVMRLQRMLWRGAVVPATTVADAPAGAAVLDALTDLFAETDKRQAALAARIPLRAVTVLGLYAIITASILGYAVGRGQSNHRLATSALFALLALTCGLILDLDRPRSGAIIVSQAPLAEVRAMMR